MKIAFRIKSGPGITRRYSPVYQSLSNLVESNFQEHIAWLADSPGPFTLEVSRDGWVTWEDVGELDQWTWSNG